MVVDDFIVVFDGFDMEINDAFVLIDQVLGWQS